MNYDRAKREIYVSGVIGDSVDGFFSADELRSCLNQLGTGPVKLIINSCGGNLHETWAMAEQLRRHDGKVTTAVQGLACSAASILFLCGEHREMSRESMVMVHHCWGVFAGNFRELAKFSEDLEKSSDTMISFYCSKLSQTRAQIQKWVDEETYFSSTESKYYGLSHRTSGDEVAASKTPNRDKAELQVHKTIAANELMIAKSVASEKFEQRVKKERVAAISSRAGYCPTGHSPTGHSPPNPRTTSWRAAAEKMLRNAEKYHDHATVAKFKQLLAKP